MHAPKLQDTLSRLAAEANQGCGLSFELFERRFSASVDAEFPISSPDRETALTLAAPMGYLTREALERRAADFADDGCCSHGIDRGWPAGCGDRE